MSTDPLNQIEIYRQKFKSYNRLELLRAKLTHKEYSDPHIAAQELLDEMDHKRREEADEKRHQEVQAKLAELQRSHWTVVPNFWLTVIAAVASVIGVILAVLQ
jgi:uncharacterized membrane protein